MDLMIYDYAKEHDVEMNEGETYGEIYQRIVDTFPQLHSREELQGYAKELMQKLYLEYDKDFKALMVFSSKPLIRTKEYHGFQDVYLYEHIHEAMGCSAQAFCKMNKITDDLDKAVLEYEFKKLYDSEVGFIRFNEELEVLVGLIKKHGFDTDYVKFLEEDLKDALVQSGDKYFVKKDLANKDNIILLYSVVGIRYGFDEFVFGVFSDYDGYGNVIFGESWKINDYSLYKEM